MSSRRARITTEVSRSRCPPRFARGVHERGGGLSEGAGEEVARRSCKLSTTAALCRRVEIHAHPLRPSPSEGLREAKGGTLPDRIARPLRRLGAPLLGGRGLTPAQKDCCART